MAIEGKNGAKGIKTRIILINFRTYFLFPISYFLFPIFLFPILESMYPIHPFTVHFPIALLLANGLLTFLYLRRGDRALETSAYHCLLLGWVGAVIATATGAIDAFRQLTGPDVPRDTLLLTWVNAHAAVGIVLVLVYGQALRQRRRQPDVLDDPQRRGGYLRLLVIGAVLVLLDGWLGGSLVYTWRMGIER